MNKEDVFYTADREAWRAYLSRNYQTKKEIYFVFPKKETGEPSLSYNDAVEEALCFGWIDSTATPIDATHSSRRFTPRRRGSTYSRPNIERLIWLDREGKLLPDVRLRVLPIIEAPYVYPADILEIIAKDPETLENFNRFSPSYQRIRLSYITDARNRPEEFQKRLNAFLSKTKENKMIVGFGGVDKYYGFE